MNKIALVCVFSALDELYKAEQYEAIKRIIDKVLKEAESKKSDD